jgi:nucleotide-binding universal stress UspA family protein
VVTATVLLCSDGSELALAALSRGLRVVAPADRTAVATVVEFVHPIDVVGTGMAGGVISPAEATRLDEEQVAEGQRALAGTCAHLGLTEAEQFVLRGGSAGLALCELAASLPATVMILGTRGRGGLRRAVLGSVSDHVVRHAPCPVVISGGD